MSDARQRRTRKRSAEFRASAPCCSRAQKKGGSETRPNYAKTARGDSIPSLNALLLLFLRLARAACRLLLGDAIQFALGYEPALAAHIGKDAALDYLAAEAPEQLFAGLVGSKRYLRQCIHPLRLLVLTTPPYYHVARPWTRQYCRQTCRLLPCNSFTGHHMPPQRHGLPETAVQRA